MRIGGHLDRENQSLPAWLHSANSGLTLFGQTRWWVSRWDCWALDITRHSQMQRIGRGEAFLRPDGIGALYRPGLSFEEWQEKGQSIHESWVLFSAEGEMQDALLSLTNPSGYCHFDDPDDLIMDGIPAISEALFYRKAGFQWFAQSTLIGLLANLVSSQRIKGGRRVVRSAKSPGRSDDLVEEVERYIRLQIEQPLSVQILATRTGQSLSAFAHQYRALAGESPYRTILRLKMEKAKYLLIQEGMSVKETARQLGFSSEFHFSRSFKRIEGIAPSLHVKTMNIKS